MSCDAGWWRSKAARSSETKMREGTMHRLWNRIDFAFSSAWQNFWRNAAVSIASVLIVGVVGAVVAVLIVGFGYRPAVVNLQSVLIFVPLAFDPYYLRVVLAAMLGFGLLLGSVGSYLGVRRFLKQ